MHIKYKEIFLIKDDVMLVGIKNVTGIVEIGKVVRGLHIYFLTFNILNWYICLTEVGQIAFDKFICSCC